MDLDLLLKILGPFLLALVSGFGILWKHIANQHVKTSDRLDRSHEEHRETQKHLHATQDTVITLSEKVGRLEGRQDGVERLARSVLDEIRLLEPKKS